MVDQSALPDAFKTGLKEISRDYKNRKSLDVDSEYTSAQFNVPLNNHSASLTLVQEKGNSSLHLNIQFFWGSPSTLALYLYSSRDP